MGKKFLEKQKNDNPSCAEYDYLTFYKTNKNFTFKQRYN